MPRRISKRLLLEHHDEPGRWIVKRWYAWAMDDGFHAEVHSGRITDLSSIPRLSRAVVPKDRTEGAGVVHDKLYATGEVSRKTADRYWRQIARSGDGASWASAWIGWTGLRIGGWVSWRAHRQD